MLYRKWLNKENSIYFAAKHFITQSLLAYPSWFNWRWFSHLMCLILYQLLATQQLCRSIIFLERLKVDWSQVFLIFLFLRHTLKIVIFVNDQTHPGSQLAKAEVRYLLLFCPSVETPGINKKRCILAHIFRGINSVSVGSVFLSWWGGKSLWWQGHMVEGEEV